MNLSRAIAVFVAGAMCASAADQPATPKEISLEAAKRELDAIKAARNPAAGPQTGVLPEISTPELHLPDSAAPSALTKRERLTREQIEAQRRSKNWLLEGMAQEKKLDEAARDGRPRRAELESERTLAAREELRSNELLDPADPAAIALREAPVADEREERSSEREPMTSTVVNPLASYMAGWMTPQDLAMLQPSMAGDGNSTARGSEIGAASTAALLAGPVGETRSVADFSTNLFGEEATTNVPSAPENPYLQLELPPSVHIEAVLAPAPSSRLSTRSAAPVFAPTPDTRQEIEPVKSKIPEFAKPSDDDKYFKQLKRF